MSTVLEFKNPKRKPIPIPESACRVISLMGGDMPDSRYNNPMYSLRRKNGATEIFLSLPGFQWNLSLVENHYPKTFKEARKWMVLFGNRYGQTITEAPKENPIIRPKGEDRKILKSGGCLERWLKSDVPALWAEASVRCEHAGGYCGQDGFCHYGTCDMQMEEHPLPTQQEE
jgi:hypothetical protein